MRGLLHISEAHGGNLYKCGGCDTRFNRHIGVNGKHQCPNCQKFAQKTGELSCEDCNSAPVAEVQGVDCNDCGEYHEEAEARFCEDCGVACLVDRPNFQMMCADCRQTWLQNLRQNSYSIPGTRYERPIDRDTAAYMAQINADRKAPASRPHRQHQVGGRQGTRPGHHPLHRHPGHRYRGGAAAEHPTQAAAVGFRPDHRQREADEATGYQSFTEAAKEALNRL